MSDACDDSWRQEAKVERLEQENKLLQLKIDGLEARLASRQNQVLEVVVTLLSSPEFAHRLADAVVASGLQVSAHHVADLIAHNRNLAKELYSELRELGKATAPGIFHRIHALENVCNLYADRPNTEVKPFTPDMISEDPVHRERSIKALLRDVAHLMKEH